MSFHAPPPIEPAGPLPDQAGQTKLYHCGPLSYTKKSLAILFAWLLWGDFCFMLMEKIGPTIIPLKLKDLGASNVVMTIIATVLPQILNMIGCPWVSFTSDRYRSRWGRRIPFIVWTLPFLSLCLVLLGFSDDISVLLRQHIAPLMKVAPATVTIGLILVFFVSFQFFNVFVNSVYWYLFNDVVPPQFLGRFMGLFRIVTTLSQIVFNEWLLARSLTHMRWLITGSAILYFVGFGLMCIFVKEGPYPPPPQDEGTPGIVNGLKAFFKKSFSAKLYWYFYLTQTFWIAGNAWGLFYIFFQQRSMGLTLQQIGHMTAIGLVVALLATYVTAVYVDRWHPLRISTYVSIFALQGIVGGIWLFAFVPPEVFYVLSLGYLVVYQFGLTLNEGTNVPMFMRMLPKSVYGQFCAANSMVRTAGGIVAGLLGGLLMDAIQGYYRGTPLGEDFAYRWVFAWPWAFGMIATIFLCMSYREWRRLGGDDNYRPPAPWKPEGYEEVADKVKSVPAKPRFVLISLWLVVIAIAVSVLVSGYFMYVMHKNGQMRSYQWFLTYLIPGKLLLLALAYWQLVMVRRNIRSMERGEVSANYGIPHHGVMLVMAIQGLVYFPVFWYQTEKMIELNLEHEQIVFALGSLLSTFLGLVVVQVIRWVERPVVLHVWPDSLFQDEKELEIEPVDLDGKTLPPWAKE